MEPSKSRGQEIYLSLCQQLLRSGPPCDHRSVNLRRDLETLESRFHAEGLSFLTKTLPRLGKWLDGVLVENTPSPPPGFATWKKSSIPAFMQAYFRRVLGDDGRVLDDADPACVLHIRQVCFVLYKLELPYSAQAEDATVAAFVQTESDLDTLDLTPAEATIALASRITSSVFVGFDPMDITPRHGPGSVATGERLEEKWEFSRLFRPIHRVYPYYDYFVVGGSREILDRLDWYRSLDRRERGIAKVVLVPKDSRGPRLISCEPLEYQWIQQGLGRKISHFLEFGSRLTRGHVNFTNQEINRDHAMSSSRTQRYATIDLKDASDRVSLDLVRSVFRHQPKLLSCFEACRTSATLLPSGVVQDLKKFAPMGSALCFPVEAYIFWVICTAAVVSRLGLPLKKVAREIYVYGDDIVVPTAWVSCCIQHLEQVGLRVNHSKCCLRGSFRESCGMDAYRGVCVTPTRVKTPWSEKASDGRLYVSWLATSNELRCKGYDHAADLILGELSRIFGEIPRGTPFSAFPCVAVDSPEEAEAYNGSKFRRRWNARYQRFEYRVLRTTSKHVVSGLDSWPRLLRNTVSPNSLDPSVIVVPRSMQIKRGWSAVY